MHAATLANFKTKIVGEIGGIYPVGGAGLWRHFHPPLERAKFERSPGWKVLLGLLSICHQTQTQGLMFTCPSKVTILTFRLSRSHPSTNGTKVLRSNPPSIFELKACEFKGRSNILPIGSQLSTWNWLNKRFVTFSTKSFIANLTSNFCTQGIAYP